MKNDLKYITLKYIKVFFSVSGRVKKYPGRIRLC
jgi:hypothetical protein